jgi:hypothetical protein
MSVNKRRSRTRLPGWVLFVGPLAWCAGCESPGPDYRAPRLRDDIVEIHQYLMRPAWVKDEEGRINGLRVRTYFLPGTPAGKDIAKGVFVSGTFTCSLYALGPRPDGTHQRELVHTWSFDARGAAGFRMTRASIMGESYGLFLIWPDDVDPTGREIMLDVKYQRRDGRVVAYRGARMRVPGPVRLSPAARIRSRPYGRGTVPTQPSATSRPQRESK